MDLKAIFTQFNLTKKEAGVYLATLELGTATAREIAKKAQVERTHFYDLAQKLVELGLLKQLRRGKKRMFSAIKPEELLKLQKQKLAYLEDALPQLKALYNTTGEKPKVFYYEGLEGIRQINQDTLNYEGERIAFATPRFLTKDQRKVSREIIKKRVAIGNRIRIIGEASNEMLELQKRDKKELRETRMLPKEIFSSKIEIGTYGNKAYIVDYKEEFGFTIEGTEIAKTLKMIFEIVWNSGRVIE